MPVTFATVHDALHAAALVIRGGQYAGLSRNPGLRYNAKEIEDRCKPILDLMSGKPPP